MRKALLISALVIVVTLGALLGYAIVNLNAIIESKRALILSRLSAALDRPVKIGTIKASLGWGIAIKVTDLRIADDPAFSQEPFVSADKIAIDVEFIPLLHGRAKLTRLHLIEPQIRIISNAAGALNLSTIGGPARSAPASSAHGSPLAALYVKSLTVENATVIYEDFAETNAKPIKLHAINLDVDNLSGIRPFAVDLRLAILSHEQNVEVSGKIGPLLHAAIFDPGAIPVDLKLQAKSIDIARLRAMARVGSRIPPQLSIAAPFSVIATATGSPANLTFTGNIDLTQQEVAWGDLFRKPAGTALTFYSGGTRIADTITVSKANLQLAALKATATGVSLGGGAPPGAKIDTNSFGLADLASLFPAAKSYGLSGTGEIHASVSIVNGKPDGSGTVALRNVAARSGHGIPPISDLTGTIRIDHRRIVLEPTTFVIASSRASVNGTAESVAPLSAGYALSIDSLRPADILKTRPPDEVVNNLVITGTARGELTAPVINAHIRSTGGLLSAVAYRNLDLTAAYAGSRISAAPLRADVFNGSVVANANATLGGRPRFGIGLTMNHVDIEQAMRSQKISAANWVHGLLTGNITAVGSGHDWNEIEPTLSGSGAMSLANGKLIGVNIVALAINGITSVPGVSQVINATFRSSHQGLLADPNTELSNASMTFALSGPRITTHDLNVQSPDYGITGDGWFDMNKNIDMDSDINLTVGLSFAIPVWVKGKLPAVIVLPNVPKLTERLAMGALSAPGRIIRGGVNAIGSVLGGGPSQGSSGSGSDGSSGSSEGSSIPNPIRVFKSLLP